MNVVAYCDPTSIYLGDVAAAAFQQQTAVSIQLEGYKTVVMMENTPLAYKVYECTVVLCVGAKECRLTLVVDALMPTLWSLRPMLSDFDVDAETLRRAFEREVGA